MSLDQSEARMVQSWKYFLVIGFAFLPILAQAASSHPNGNRLRAELPCILKSILEIRKLTFNTHYPLPELVLDTETDLKSYQDDVEPQWNFRPDAIVNVFVAHRNRIYLYTNPDYYKPKKRFVEDSLAHELFHYVQVYYDGIPVDQFSDFDEMAAVEIQNQFREKYQDRLESGRSLCEASKF